MLINEDKFIKKINNFPNGNYFFFKIKELAEINNCVCNFTGAQGGDLRFVARLKGLRENQKNIFIITCNSKFIRCRSPLPPEGLNHELTEKIKKIQGSEKTMKTETELFELNDKSISIIENYLKNTIKYFEK